MITLPHASGAVVLFPFFAIIFQIRVKTLEFLKPGILISLLGKSAPKKLLIGSQNGCESISQPHLLNQSVGFFILFRDMSKWKDTVLLRISETVH